MSFIFLFVMLSCISVIVITLYGYLGALVSYKLGDDSDEIIERMSFDPRKHIDKIGLILMILMQIGFTKPLKNDETKFQNQKRDTLLVVVLPGLILAFATFIVFICTYWFSQNVAYFWLLYLITYFMYITSVGVFLYNLIPIIPLAGGKFFGVLANPYVKERMRQRKTLVAAFLIIITFLIVVTGVFFYIAELPINILFS